MAKAVLIMDMPEDCNDCYAMYVSLSERFCRATEENLSAKAERTDWCPLRKLPERSDHPEQKPVVVLKKLIEIFTDPGDVVIDPCCGSGSTLRAAAELGRNAYGFEIDRNFYTGAKEKMLVFETDNQISFEDIPGVMP